ncbi:MAG: cytochrome P460 family protein, partial [Acidobacteriaceae bacterium]|nr:cytochrome P460 family protein [Acidobacteriaceae bacterium]
MKGSIDESRDSVDERQGRPTKLVVRKCRSSDSNGQFVKKPFPRGVEDRTIGLRRRGLAAIGEGEMKSNQKRTFLNRARRPANGLCASFLNRARRPPNGLCASLRHLIVFAILLAIASVITAAENSAEVPFPEGYASWQHVKSVVIGPEHKSFASEGGKVFHFYANPQAIEGYRTGRFPNGSVIVRETLRTIAGEGESKGILTEGERSSLDVMVKDDR